LKKETIALLLWHLKKRIYGTSQHPRRLCLYTNTHFTGKHTNKNDDAMHAVKLQALPGRAKLKAALSIPATPV
jgi:hypothetical protein